jgi:hypothetical protein
MLPVFQSNAAELAREIFGYTFVSPMAGEAAVPGLNHMLQRMLVVNPAARFRDAAEAADEMEWVTREPDADLCRAMLEQRVVPALRSLFLQHWAKKAGSPWKDTAECGQRYLEEELKRNRKAANWLIRERLAKGDSAAWDATALCSILLWSQLHPLRADESPEDHDAVSQIREWRNELAHRVAWDADKSARCAVVMWDFIERHSLPTAAPSEGGGIGLASVTGSSDPSADVASVSGEARVISE